MPVRRQFTVIELGAGVGLCIMIKLCQHVIGAGLRRRAAAAIGLLRLPGRGRRARPKVRRAFINSL